METETIDLGNGVMFELQYWYPYDGGQNLVDYLHLIRTGSIQVRSIGADMEERYWIKLEELRSAFANGIGGKFDLIVDPPSNKGYHRPYLSAVLRKFSRIRCCRLKKETDLSADPNNFPQLLEGCQFFRKHDEKLDEHHSVLIVDDVYSTGTTAKVTIIKLKEAGLPDDATIVVACPLRIFVDQTAKQLGEMLASGNDL